MITLYFFNSMYFCPRNHLIRKIMKSTKKKQQKKLKDLSEKELRSIYGGESARCYYVDGKLVIVYI